MAPVVRNISPRCRKACNRRIGSRRVRGFRSASFGKTYTLAATQNTKVLNRRLTVRMFIALCSLLGSHYASAKWCEEAVSALRALLAVVRLNNHAVPVNIDRLSVFGQRLRRLWRLPLRRRSQQPVPWAKVSRIFATWLFAPRVLHPYPAVRFLATHPRWKPYGLTRPYGSLRGAVSE